MRKFIAVIFSSSTSARIRDFILWMIATICMLLAIVVTVLDRTTAGAVLFSAGILLFIISTLSRFESFKGLGIEAKMKVLDSKIGEADRLLRHIRTTSVLMAEISFQVMARIGRWDGTVPKTEALAIADGLTNQLKELGADDAQINRCMAPWHQTNIQDLIVPIYNDLQSHLLLRNQEIIEESQRLPLPIDISNVDWVRLNNAQTMNSKFLGDLSERWKNNPESIVSEIDEIVESIPFGSVDEHKALHTKLKSRLDDADFYMKNKKFKNPDEWVKVPYGH